MKFVTAFNDEETENIRGQIKNLARNHNRLIRDTLDIDIADWRNAVLPPEVRELAVQTQRIFEHYISSSAYSGRYMTPALTSGYVFANWWDHPDKFPRPGDADVSLSLHGDVASEFVARFDEMCSEWLAAAIDYGMVLDVFDWLNGEGSVPGFCGKGERRWLRTCLPCVTALVAKDDPRLASTLKPLTGASRAAVPVEHIDAVMRANQIIAGALLLPEYPLKEKHHIEFTLSVAHVKHSLWFREFTPLAHT